MVGRLSSVVSIAMSQSSMRYLSLSRVGHRDLGPRHHGARIAVVRAQLDRGVTALRLIPLARLDERPNLLKSGSARVFAS